MPTAPKKTGNDAMSKVSVKGNHIQLYGLSSALTWGYSSCKHCHVFHILAESFFFFSTPGICHVSASCWAPHCEATQGLHLFLHTQCSSIPSVSYTPPPPHPLPHWLTMSSLPAKWSNLILVWFHFVHQVNTGASDHTKVYYCTLALVKDPSA